MLPDEPTDEDRLEELPEDNGTPFTPAEAADGASNSALDTHPATDTNIQPEELYDEGVGGAAEIEEPPKDTGVVDFNPPQNDQNSEKS